VSLILFEDTVGFMGDNTGVLGTLGIKGISFVVGVVEDFDLGFLGGGVVVSEALSDAEDFLLLVTTDEEVTGYTCLPWSRGIQRFLRAPW